MFGLANGDTVMIRVLVAERASKVGRNQIYFSECTERGSADVWPIVPSMVVGTTMLLQVSDCAYFHSPSYGCIGDPLRQRSRAIDLNLETLRAPRSFLAFDPGAESAWMTDGRSAS